MVTFEEMQEKVAGKIQEMTRKNIKELSQIWFETFDRTQCDENLLKLCDHVDIFYNEVKGETVHRRDRIQSQIDELHKEASTLRRLLKVEITLSPQKGVPLYTELIKLDNSLQDLRRKLKERKNEIIELLLEQESLCEKLGESRRDLHDDPLPTEFELNDFRQHLSILRGEKIKRVELMADLRRETKGYLADLELSMQSESEVQLLTDRHMPPTWTILNQLMELRDQYRTQVDEVRKSIDTMKAKLKVLWAALETSPSVCQKFARYTDYSQTTYDKLYREMDRCELLKRQNIKRFVDQIRGEIVEWWDKTLKSDLEKARFSNFMNDCYTEDLLTLHEMELEDLKRYYQNNEKIFELIEMRRVLWDRMVALEAKATEPGRFNNRGGQLLKEEKERKTIATKLPKIEAELTELVNEYESVHNRKFLIYGDEIIASMEHDWEMKKVEKEKLMSARKNANVTNTPISKNVHARTPLSIRNHSTIKKMPSSTNVSAIPSTIKRKLLHTDTLLPNAKRSLMNELGSPIPSRKTPFKSPAKKNRIIATTIKRRSGRTSGNIRSTRKRSMNKTPMKPPKIVITKENTVTSDTMSYDVFEEYIEKDPSCRSSIVVGKGKKTRRSARNHHLFAEYRGASPHKTPPSSPAAGPSRKLTTKNLPILI